MAFIPTMSNFKRCPPGTLLMAAALSIVMPPLVLEAQANGDPAGDKSRLRMDAGKIKQQYPEDAFPAHAAWLDWPWKLHRVQAKSGKKPLELYNLECRPLQKTNIADKQADHVEKLHAALKQWLASVVRSLNGKDY